MRFSRRVSCLILPALSLAATTAARAQLSRSDSSAIVATTRRLLDAITDGDSSIWAPYLAPAWFLIDEEGRRLTRAEFLRGLRPLPAGQHGTLDLGAWHLVSAGTAAVMSYDIEERHDYHGIPLATRFHTTDTWARMGGRWMLLASQVTALPTPVKGEALPAALLTEYTGRYRLIADSARAAGLGLTIEADSLGLTVRRGDRPPERLHALTPAIFIRHGVRGFWVFERDGAGVVRRVVNWRDNNALEWGK